MDNQLHQQLQDIKEFITTNQPRIELVPVDRVCETLDADLYEIHKKLNTILEEVFEQQQKLNKINDLIDSSIISQLELKSFVMDEIRALNKIDFTISGVPESKPEYINQTQLEELQYELYECPEIRDSVHKRLGINSLDNLERSKYRQVINEIRRIKYEKLKMSI